jgi:hypothetical protein
MAQAPRESGGGAAEFVRNVVSDPKNVPDVMLLRGYPGASSEEAHERLYLSADLSSYVEIPRTAILHQAAVPSEQDSNGAITVWVRKDAALQYKMAPAAQAMANYFAGAIQAGAQGAAVGHGVAGAIQPTPTAIPTHYLICQPHGSSRSVRTHRKSARTSAPVRRVILAIVRCRKPPRGLAGPPSRRLSLARQTCGPVPMSSIAQSFVRRASAPVCRTT